MWQLTKVECVKQEKKKTKITNERTYHATFLALTEPNFDIFFFGVLL